VAIATVRGRSARQTSNAVHLFEFLTQSPRHTRYTCCSALTNARFSIERDTHASALSPARVSSVAAGARALFSAKGKQPRGMSTSSAMSVTGPLTPTASEASSGEGRITHNAIEKRRRDRINAALAALTELVPECAVVTRCASVSVCLCVCVSVCLCVSVFVSV
jgi:hypothetical protein